MCGIAGICDFEPERPIEKRDLARMIGMLRSRGPDSTGFHVGKGIGLGHARLSIVDPLGGRQPLCNEDGSIWLVCNGEVFNYVELRAELIARGHRFRTGSDCEVIVHLYEEHGPDFVHQLNGQFAIALWDSRERRLLLIRDRVGIQPLFYTRQGRRLLFASEAKGILPLLEAAPRLNPAALEQVMTFWAPLAPDTPFDGIYQLGAGEMLIVSATGERKICYWDWSFPSPDGFHQGSEEELGEQLHDLLVDAVRLRLRADVPVGAYLSGGLDSSSLVALAQAQRPAALRTWSLRFEHASLDEGEHQRALIDGLGVDNQTVMCRGEDIATGFPDAVWRAETPFLRTAPVPMAVLSRSVREHGFKVVITGEGADEVLGGYDLFKEAKIRRYWAQRPESQRRAALMRRLYPYLGLGAQGQAYLQHFFGVGLDAPDAPFFSHLPRWQNTARIREFLSPELRAATADGAMERLLNDLPDAFAGWHPFNRAQYLECKTLLPGYLLSSQGDRMLMANGIEGRFPFLDHRLIEFAAGLSPRLKMKVLTEKYLLRQVMRPYLPSCIGRRKKQPYRAPDIPAFFSGREPSYVQELLEPETVARYGYFDPGKVALLLRKIRRGRAQGYRDNIALVGLLSTQLWHYLFIESFYRLCGARASRIREIEDAGEPYVGYSKGT